MISERLVCNIDSRMVCAVSYCAQLGELAIIYVMMARANCGIEAMCEMLKKSILLFVNGVQSARSRSCAEPMGEAKRVRLSTTANDPDYVNQLFVLHSVVRIIVDNAFRGDNRFVKSGLAVRVSVACTVLYGFRVTWNLKRNFLRVRRVSCRQRAFEQVINQKTLDKGHPEILAAFIDQVLKGRMGTTRLNADQVNNAVDGAIMLFAYLMVSWHRLATFDEQVSW